MKTAAIRFSLAAALLATAGLFNAAHAQGNGSEGQGAPEVIKHRTNPHAVSGNVTAGGTAPLSAITYHGGALIQTPTAYVVWYGNWNQTNGSDTPAGQQIVRDFLNSVGGSNYYKINSSYSTNGYSITGGLRFGGETTDTGSRGTRLRDSDILTIVNSAITSGRLPYDTTGIYFVLTSSNVTETSGFCTKYCGWHTAGTPSAGHVRYSFVGNAQRCLSSCAAQSVSPNNNAGVDGMLSVLAHEAEEATTDADPSSGWVDSSGAENADKCAWTFGSQQTTLPNGSVYNVTLGTRHYLIQRNLKATDNKCYIDGVNNIQ